MEKMTENPAPIKSYKGLIVWKSAMGFALDVYKVTGNFPKSEQSGLTSQMRRAAVSVPSNIAEGWGRNSAAGFIYFLRIAFGSMSELMTQIEIAFLVNYLSNEQMKELEIKGTQISKMLFVLIQKAERRVRKG